MTVLDRLAERIATFGSVSREVPMSRHTTFGVGGPADLFVTVDGAEALAEAITATKDAGVPWFVLGSGSNILVADAGIRGVVIDNRARAEERLDGELIRLESGTSFAGVSRRMCREGRAGLTWAVGIPGTLGGAVVYNAGAYGGCLADVLTAVEMLDADGERRWHAADELGLVYRGSVLTRASYVDRAVTRVELRLEPADPAVLVAAAAEHDRKRLAAQPRGRNAGSMFKNPPEGPAWKLIDAVGLRGARRGDAGISDKHCNFFVNQGNATAEDVAMLVVEAERRVREQFGVELVREVAFVGEWS